MRHGLSKIAPAVGLLAGGIIGYMVASPPANLTLEEAVQSPELRELYIEDVTRTVKGIRVVYDDDRSKYVEHALANIPKMRMPHLKDGEYVLLPPKVDSVKFEEELRQTTRGFSLIFYPEDFGLNREASIFVHAEAFNSRSKVDNAEIFLETEIECALEMARKHQLGMIGELKIPSDIGAGLQYHGILLPMLQADGLYALINTQRRHLGAAQVDRVTEFQNLVNGIEQKKSLPPELNEIVKSWVKHYNIHGNFGPMY